MTTVGIVSWRHFSCCCISCPPHQEAKISSTQAATHLARFVKEGVSLTTFLEKNDTRQPFLLSIGEQKKNIQRFYIVVDQKAIPCDAPTSAAAFDKLFKAHFVFSLSYDEALSSFYTFIQTTIYNIDVGNTKESPRVKELSTSIARTLKCPKVHKLIGVFKKQFDNVHMLCL
ncbi:hypothetical protein CHARACLAT_029948 [Characodon lateralis]|uniref:Uncharacterized protein n=1 Tax=Characodon lateralis TaxID=208331 RepID=A0ABU7D3P7_9TELE|nr:hypothetical protein [Characodon lateralis]